MRIVYTCKTRKTLELSDLDADVYQYIPMMAVTVFSFISLSCVDAYLFLPDCIEVFTICSECHASTHASHVSIQVSLVYSLVSIVCSSVLPQVINKLPGCGSFSIDKLHCTEYLLEVGPPTFTTM